MTKRTNLKLRIAETYFGSDIVIDENGNRIFTTYTHTPKEITNLLLSAPELLEALIEIKRLYGDREDYIDEYKTAWEQVNNAIKKSTI